MESQKIEELGALLDRLHVLIGEVDKPNIIRDALDTEQLDTLRTIYEICVECEELEEGDLLPLKKTKKRKRGLKSQLGGPGDPWKRITNLEILPALPVFVTTHLKKYPADTEAENFLRALSLASNCGQYSSADDLGNAFMARYKWTQQVERRDEKIHIFQLFNDLFWFDMMQLLRPHGTGRVGAMMRVELDRFLTPLDFDKMGLQKHEVMANVGDWSIRGAKIHKLCVRYGPGVILVLHKQLSRSFLEGRFTASGPYYNGAINRLDSLGLNTYINNSGAELLAISIRNLLIKPFQEAQS
ncbi:hypothetical protein J3E72DRAFT_373639 [Bipolaris maydis]|nr:hypothetical protein J3E74DRAFT_404537 [Bipolaris maydis]KAJ6199181.1 hypothetical protein J3E72DRAFT_373639 [Bipolaris maydis]